MPEKQLSPQQLKMLNRVAQGQEYCQIAQELGVSRWTARNTLKAAQKKMDAHNRSSAVAFAIRSNIISLENIVPKDYDFNRFNDLTPRQKNLLHTFVDQDGVQTTRQIADQLVYDESTIKGHFHHIFATLNTNTRPQLMTVCLAAKKEGFL